MLAGAWIALLLACSGNDDSRGEDPHLAAEAILTAAQRAVGRQAAGHPIQILADARVDGPRGEFRTVIHSSSDGRVRMAQPHSGLLAGIGRCGGWWRDAATGEVGELGNRLGIVRGHELHMLALAPLSRLSDPRFLAATEFDSRPALAVRLSLPTGDSLIAYFDSEDTLPLGLRMTAVEPDVVVSWREWEDVDGVRLFRSATFRQEDELFTYRYERLEIGAPEDSLFEPPVNESDEIR